MEFGDEFRQQQGSGRRDCPQANGACNARTDLGNLAYRAVHHAKDVFDAGIKHTSGIRQADTPAASLKELYAQRILQTFHLPRQRRLGNIKALSSMTDIPFLDNSVKRTHIFDFHILCSLFLAGSLPIPTNL